MNIFSIFIQNHGNVCSDIDIIMFLFLQIITKIKWHNDSNVETVDFICNRIFELTDKNKDSE